MFIGYQDKNISFIGNTKEELENLPCVELTKIEEVDFAEMYNGKIYIKEEELIEAKKVSVRETRDFYLEKYVDPVVSNPLRWNDMSEEEKKEYSDYRKYLLDYPETKDWYEQNPKTFLEFING